MNTYLITFANGRKHPFSASDSDMAIIGLRKATGNDTRVVSMLLDGIELVSPEPPIKLPPRRARGLTLSAEYDDGRWHFRVTRFGYSASLALAADLGILIGFDGQRELSAADMEIVDEWAGYQDDYAVSLTEAMGKTKSS